MGAGGGYGQAGNAAVGVAEVTHGLHQIIGENERLACEGPAVRIEEFALQGNGIQRDEKGLPGIAGAEAVDVVDAVAGQIGEELDDVGGRARDLVFDDAFFTGLGAGLEPVAIDADAEAEVFRVHFRRDADADGAGERIGAGRRPEEATV